MLPLQALKQENGATPLRRTLPDATRPIGTQRHLLTNLVVMLRMEPASTNISPTNVVVYIDTKSGKMPVKIGPDGAFSVPMTKELLTENPWLITNQPRGSMKLDWFMGLVVRRLGTVLSYRPLMQVVRDCADVRERMRAVFPGAPKAKVAGLKLVFSPPGTSATCDASVSQPARRPQIGNGPQGGTGHDAGP